MVEEEGERQGRWDGVTTRSFCGSVGKSHDTWRRGEINLVKKVGSRDVRRRVQNRVYSGMTSPGRICMTYFVLKGRRKV